MQNKPEVWLRGPIPQIPILLQPVAHALLQAREELEKMLISFPEDKLLNKFYGMASTAFHLQHLSGVLDRLFTYAKGESLSGEQFAYLKNEGFEKLELTTRILFINFVNQVDKALIQLENANIDLLTATYYVGKAKIQTTQMGLYVHAAEHTMRHIGQLVVTINALKSS